MKQKEVVIVVPGAKYIKSRAKFIQNLIYIFYKATRIFKPVYTNYAKEWAKKFDNNNKMVFWLHWSRGITTFSKWRAIKRLKRLIKIYDSHPIKLVGISLGGEIILELLSKWENHSVKKIILVASTNENKNVQINNTKIINIFSRKDLFAQLSIGVLSPFFGGQKLNGKNVKNIILPNITHDEFCSDVKIKEGKFKGTTITELINRFLKN
jgi:hypothetical protein